MERKKCEQSRKMNHLQITPDYLKAFMVPEGDFPSIPSGRTRVRRLPGRHE